jgi:hypothetical protein
MILMPRLRWSTNSNSQTANRTWGPIPYILTCLYLPLLMMWTTRKSNAVSSLKTASRLCSRISSHLTEHMYKYSSRGATVTEAHGAIVYTQKLFKAFTPFSVSWTPHLCRICVYDGPLTATWQSCVSARPLPSTSHGNVPAVPLFNVCASSRVSSTPFKCYKSI